MLQTSACLHWALFPRFLENKVREQEANYSASAERDSSEINSSDVEDIYAEERRDTQKRAANLTKALRKGRENVMENMNYIATRMILLYSFFPPEA